VQGTASTQRSENMEAKKEELKEEELKQGNISLILEDYNDIFSDFDPREYHERTLSDDFLLECRKAARGKTETLLELRLLIPEKKRDKNIEANIKKRIKTYYQHRHAEIVKETKKIRHEGANWVIIGAAFMLTGAVLYTKFPDSHDFLFNLILVIIEPGGWFSMWTGLDKLFMIGESEKKQEVAFLSKLEHMEINFYGF